VKIKDETGHDLKLAAVAVRCPENQQVLTVSD